MNTSEAVPGSSTLTPELFRRLHPKPYLEKFLSEGIRPDGRELSNGRVVESQNSSFRETSINLGSISTAPASALVRIGSTTVVCGITLEIATPDIASPHHGFIVPNIDLPALCSPLFRPGPPSDEAQVLSSRLREILLASNILPLSSLIIEPGKAAFVVYLDVVCLNFDGGVLDAAVLACVGALRSLKLPIPTWDIDTNSVTCAEPTETSLGTAIELGPAPLTVSFGFFNGHLLPDPTQFEFELCTTHISITLASDSTDLLNLYQVGAPLKSTTEGGKTSQELLQECITLARARAEQIVKSATDGMTLYLRPAGWSRRKNTEIEDREREEEREYREEEREDRAEDEEYMTPMERELYGMFSPAGSPVSESSELSEVEDEVEKELTLAEREYDQVYYSMGLEAIEMACEEFGREMKKIRKSKVEVEVLEHVVRFSRLDDDYSRLDDDDYE